MPSMRSSRSGGVLAAALWALGAFILLGVPLIVWLMVNPGSAPRVPLRAEAPSAAPEPAPDVPAPPAEPVASAPAEPVEEPPSEAPAGPDPALLQTIAQTVQGYTDAVYSIKLELVAAEQELLNWSRELWNTQAHYGRLAGELAEIIRVIPQFRITHSAQVQRVVDRANALEDRATADTLWRELGQFEATLAQLEAQTQGMVSTADTGYQALKAWDPLVSGWRIELAGLREELYQREQELPTLRALTAWEPALEHTGATLADLGTRVATFRQGLQPLRADLDARAVEAQSIDAFIKTWSDFREQWRTYLLER